MTSKPLIVAQLLPIRAQTLPQSDRQNTNLVQIEVKNITDFCLWDDSSTDSMDGTDSTSDKPKRKRERLDHLSQEEKIKRRKLHNRAAAQLARDRKKVKMEALMQSVDSLSKQKLLLQKSNELLKLRNKALEKENQELKDRLSLMSNQSLSQSKEGSFESAELINVSQQQKHESLRHWAQWTKLLIYWLAIMNLMKSSTFSTSALNNFSRPTLTPTLRPLSAKCWTPPQTAFKTMCASSWSPSKT